MLLSLRDALCGCVTVEVRGFSVERFCNLAVNKGLCLLALSRGDDGAARFRVSVKGFRALRECARKTHCKIRIAGKSGLPFLLFRHRKRKILAVGAMLIVCALYALTSFVWVVDIEGAARLEEESLRAFLAAEGLSPGARKADVLPRTLERAVLAQFGDIAFAHIQLTGTRAVLRMAETILPPETANEAPPCDLVAQKDGLILSIVTSAGTPMVKAGDVVRAGDVLVSGTLVYGEEGGTQYISYVHAQADIRAKLFYEMEFDVPLTYTEKQFTGRRKIVYSLCAGESLLRPYDPQILYTHYEKMLFPTRLTFGLGDAFPFSLVWQREEYREFIPEAITRTVEQAELLGAEMAKNRVLREFSSDAAMVGTEVSFMELPGAVRVYARITTVESIGGAQIITPPMPTE